MIKFEWNGRKLIVDINYGSLLGKRTYELRNDLDEIDATLRVIHLNDELDRRLKEIHEKAYKKGWEDHKKKQPKETYFDRGWEPMK